MNKQTNNTNADRIRRHREHAAARGIKRIEIRIPDKDVKLVKSLAGVLQDGGKPAYNVRNTLNAIIPKNKQNIVDFFHRSPLAEFAEELDLTRDNDTGNPLEF